MTEDCQAVVAAPGFALGVRCTGSHITEIRFLPPQPEMPATTPLAAEAASQLRAWLADPDFAFDLPLAAAGTAFQNRVWGQVLAIPRGATRSYGELARALDSAPRAVGQACGANPYPVVVPCHRVVAAGGTGGFAHSREGPLLDIKHWLLAH
ncbi:MAG: methylated-DNA--[protein]-cysteine S-methyltransferase [Betaproteobacteria bacterium]|nr:methylated-DNA--[protein]-cysteine S-methyltransferase [Betaproteobacteria bacterium]